MSLATVEQVAAQAGRPVAGSDIEVARVEALLTKASVLVRGYCRREFDPPPEAVQVTVAGMVVRALRSSEGIADAEQMSAGPFGVRFTAGSTASDPWLTAMDKMTLRPYRRGGGSVSMPTVSERE